ncbi:MAG: hypothetical protein NC087_04400 [Anaeroplasma bactoclasticum]|nr:hypothetical protein [Anaeroplasma bactoclasticum]
MDLNYKTSSQRFATLLFYQLQGRMPRPGTNLHKYSKGAMLRGYRMYITNKGFRLVMSEGVKYSHYAMGYNDDGSQRKPRGWRETYNFQTIKSCIESVARIVASSTGGKVTYD